MSGVQNCLGRGLSLKLRGTPGKRYPDEVAGEPASRGEDDVVVGTLLAEPGGEGSVGVSQLLEAMPLFGTLK